MYRNVDEALRDAYRFGALRIEPMGNTGQICRWMESKGASGGSGLTQAEWHANAAMIQARVERLLTPCELAAVECEYGKVDLHNIIDLTAYIEQQNSGVNLLICDALLEHLFTGRPTQVQIQDKFDIGRSTLWRRKKQISKIVAGLLYQACCKLEVEFERCGVLFGRESA